MLALRLARGSHPLALLRGTALVCASAGVGGLLLTTLGHALAHPGQPRESLARLLWCLVPLAFTAALAGTLARTDPADATRAGLTSAGLGPARLPLLTAAGTALWCALGSVLALLALGLSRAGTRGLPLPGRAGAVPLPAQSLPLPASLTLLCAVPLAAGAAAGWAALTATARPPGRVRRLLRAGYRRSACPAGPAGGDVTGAAPEGASRTAHGVPACYAPVTGRDRPRRAHGPRHTRARWRAGGGALAPVTVAGPVTVTGAVTGAVTGRRARPRPRARAQPVRPVLGGTLTGCGLLAAGLALAAGGGRLGLPPLGGWPLAALGLVLAGPGLVHVTGLLLAARRPGPVRLLSGRRLQREAPCVGRPLGALCAVLSGTLAGAAAYRTSGRGAGELPGLPGLPGPPGALTALGGAVVLGCVAVSALLAVVRARHARAGRAAVLLRLGASRRLRWRTALLRTAVLATVLAAVTALLAAALAGLVPPRA
ncbi:hypothetical protein [Streptomyces boncukensis]|uniref:Uncharacterized protein n=1 Tax=Streptomyces boncukensis TaxID=2711219 RepID=A0A6G4WS91_9ACTN|nr:hypothetical protein [Streptomyces boncukensis]NGO68136.1 hypothetical protein [Streptomyces boncukensis]